MAFLQTETLWVNQLADGVADLVLDVPGGRDNLLALQALNDLERALEKLDQQNQFRVLVLRTGKEASFCHGIDPGYLAELSSAEDFANLAHRGQAVCDQLAGLKIPTLALISGACLGAGLDLALACDYRVAVAKITTRLGFPEAEMGLLPAWGATPRLLNCVGLERGLQLALGLRRLSAAEALSWGLVDEIAQPGDSPPPSFLEHPVKRSQNRWPLRSARQKIFETNRLGRWLIFRGTDHLLRKRLPDDMPAPWACLEAVRDSVNAGRDTSLAREREAAAELSQTEAFHNLLKFQIQRTERRRDRGHDQRGAPIRKVGILGASAGATALTYLAATHGCQVVIREPNEMALGMASFRMMALFQQEATRGVMSRSDMMQGLSGIRGTTAWRDFEDVDIVLDASEGASSAKKQLMRQVEKHVSPKTPLVTVGMESLMLEIQEGLMHPERVAGLHLLRPAGLWPLVEVVTSPKTGPEVQRRLCEFVIFLGRTPHVTPDLPGHLVHRYLFPYWNEAVLLMQEGYQPQRIDQAMQRFGMDQGPLEQMDELGLGVVQELAGKLQKTLSPRIEVNAAFAVMVERGWLGRTSNNGFFNYRGKRRKPHAALLTMVRAQAGGKTLTPASVVDQLADIQRRLVWLLINEAPFCVMEGRAASHSDLDTAMAYAGWPAHRGGPFRYARYVGIEQAIAQLHELAAAHGPRYQPSPALEKLLRSN